MVTQRGALTLPSMENEPDTQTVTIFLKDQKSASERIRQLLPLVHDQLRTAAQRHMTGERVGHTLAAAGLVHESHLKLIGPREIPWQSRGHF